MKSLKQRIAKAFGGGTSKERGASNLEIVVWISVVLVIAVGMFLLRDNIAKFINNAALQIASEESGDGLNEYGFYYGKIYWYDNYLADGVGVGMAFYEDGSRAMFYEDGTPYGPTDPQGSFTYNDGVVKSVSEGYTCEISNNGKSMYYEGYEWTLQE